MIVCDPDILGGQPTIQGSRVSVKNIAELVSAGESIDTILEEYYYIPLTEQLIEDCIRVHNRLKLAYTPEDYIPAGQSFKNLMRSIKNFLLNAEVRTYDRKTNTYSEVLDNVEELRSSYARFKLHQNKE